MKDTWFKILIRFLFFHPGSIRTIRFGPMKGMVFQVNSITGLSPWYSGVEREHQRSFKALVCPGDIVADIGANWGSHTLCLSRLVGRTGTVIAVEPFPPAFSQLLWHIQANGCLNVKPLNIALSDTNNIEHFTVGELAQTGSLSSIHTASHSATESISVTTRTLDSLIQELGIKRLKLVKIDVEGGETKVLLGAKWTMEHLRPYFIIELHTPEQDVSVARQFTSQGYQLSRLSGPPILCTDKGWPERTGVWGHILAQPNA